MATSHALELSPRAARAVHVPSWLRKAAGMLLGMSVVNAGNYAINIVFGRYLSPESFGEIVFTTTWLLIIGAGSLAIQAATARGVAAGVGSGQASAQAAVIRDATRFAITVGALLAFGLAAFAAPLAHLFRIASSTPFLWLSALAPVLLWQGVRRGAMQGRDQTLRLTITFQVEMLVRLLGSSAALALGYQVNAVCAMLFLSVVASATCTGFERPVAPVSRPTSAPPSRRAFAAMIVPALVAQLSVMAFTQVDIVVVKARATPQEAGTFAIVVLIGRIISFATQAVSTPLLPAVVSRVTQKQKTGDLLAGGLGAVALVAMPLVAIGLFRPDDAVRTLFGAAHLGAAAYVGTYAVAMFIHGLASILTDYTFCRGVTKVAYVAAGIGALRFAAALMLVRDARSAISLGLVASIVLLTATTVVAMVTAKESP